MNPFWLRCGCRNKEPPCGCFPQHKPLISLQKLSTHFDDHLGSLICLWSFWFDDHKRDATLKSLCSQRKLLGIGGLWTKCSSANHVEWAFTMRTTHLGELRATPCGLDVPCAAEIDLQLYSINLGSWYSICLEVHFRQPIYSFMASQFGSTIHQYDTLHAHARPVTRRSPGFQVSEHFAHTELVTGITSVTAPTTGTTGTRSGWLRTHGSLHHVPSMRKESPSDSAQSQGIIIWGRIDWTLYKQL